MSILCKLGVHSWNYKTKYLPSICAEIVTEYICTKVCRRCATQVVLAHEKWDFEREEFFSAM